MTSDIMFSTKSYRNNWLSQFGLYRYESAGQKKTESIKNVPNGFRYGCVAVVILLLILLLLIFLHNLSYENPRKQFLYVKNPNQTNRRSDTLSNVQLTTVYYPDQISSYRTFDRNPFVSTTPTNFKRNDSELYLPTSNTEYYDNDEYLNINDGMKSMSLKSDEDYFHPQNHRKRYIDKSEKYTDNNDELVDYFLKPEKPSGFKMTHHAGSKIIFPEMTSIRSSAGVKSIRDIINQANDDHNRNSDSAFSPSISRARGIRIEGTYRRFKSRDFSDEDENISSLSSIQSIQKVPAYSKGEDENRAKDLFSRFKPASPSDVNTLASTNRFRNSLYRHNKPRPVTDSKIPITELRKPVSQQSYAGDYYDPETVYRQIILANNNRMKTSTQNSRTEKLQKNQKPFSLMLDVYPMPDEESVTMVGGISTTKRPYPMTFKKPMLPININHNLQFPRDHSYYNHMKFPQLQSYRYPSDHHNYYNSMYFRNFLSNRQNNLMNPIAMTSAPIITSIPLTENTPSQIMVHLNLFPSKKRTRTAIKAKNIEILDTNSSEDIQDRQINVPEKYADAKNISFRQLNEQHVNQFRPKLLQSALYNPHPNIPNFSSIDSNPPAQHEFLSSTGRNKNSPEFNQQISKNTSENITFIPSQAYDPINRHNHYRSFIPTELANLEANSTPVQGTASTFVYSTPDVVEQNHSGAMNTETNDNIRSIFNNNTNSSYGQRLEKLNTDDKDRQPSFQIQQQKMITLS